MELNLVSGWLRSFIRVKLTCGKCDRVTIIGLDRLAEMSSKNDDFTWWRARFACARCKARNPYLALVPTHLTPVDKGVPP